MSLGVTKELLRLLLESVELMMNALLDKLDINIYLNHVVKIFIYNFASIFSIIKSNKFRITYYLILTKNYIYVKCWIKNWGLESLPHSILDLTYNL